MFYENNENPILSFTAPNPSEDASESIDEELQKDTIDEDGDGSVTINVNGKYMHCLTIIGQVEGHYTLPTTTKTTKYEHIIPRIVAIEENKDISGLLLILNTIGGDIVLRMGRGFVSHTICTILSDTVQFSHCGIVVRQNDSLYVVHSVSEELSEHDGVQATSLHHFVYESVPGSLAFVRYKTELDSLGDLMRQKALYYLANPKPFDYDFDLNDSTAFFCSELPLHILKHHLNVDLCVPLGNYPKFSLFLDTIHFKRVY